MKNAAVVLMVLALGSLGGCAFGHGFRDRGAQMAGEMAADELADMVDKKLGADFGEVKDILGKLPGQIPQPPGPADTGLLYTLGSLAAYIVGSFGKGALRKYSGKKSA